MNTLITTLFIGPLLYHSSIPGAIHQLENPIIAAYLTKKLSLVMHGSD